MKSKLSNAKRPWPADAHREVSGLRKAITAQLGEPMVDSAAAPMMGELLARLEGFANPKDPGELKPPPLPPDRESMSQGEAAALLQDACTSLQQRLHGGADDPRTQNSLQAMVRVIENHLTMKSEVLARAARDQ